MSGPPPLDPAQLSDRHLAAQALGMGRRTDSPDGGATWEMALVGPIRPARATSAELGRGVGHNPRLGGGQQTRDNQTIARCSRKQIWYRILARTLLHTSDPPLEGSTPQWVLPRPPTQASPFLSQTASAWSLQGNALSLNVLESFVGVWRRTPTKHERHLRLPRARGTLA